MNDSNRSKSSSLTFLWWRCFIVRKKSQCWPLNPPLPEKAQTFAKQISRSSLKYVRNLSRKCIMMSVESTGLPDLPISRTERKSEPNAIVGLSVYGCYHPGLALVMALIHFVQSFDLNSYLKPTVFLGDWSSDLVGILFVYFIVIVGNVAVVSQRGAAAGVVIFRWQSGHSKHASPSSALLVWLETPLLCGSRLLLPAQRR